MRFRYSQTHLTFLTQGYQHMQVPALTQAFNQRFGLRKSATAIKCALSNHGCKCGRPPGNPKGTLRVFTPEQIEFLRVGYRRLSVPELTQHFNRTFGAARSASSIEAALNNRKFLSGRTGRFEPGLKPWNKNSHFVAGGRSAETRFKPGHRPRNWLPIGSERFSKEGYLKRKVRDDAPPGLSRKNWRYVHTMLWEEHHGPVPATHALLFRNGDKTDIRLENLTLVARAELLYLNRKGLAGLGVLSPAAEALARLEAKRFQLTRGRTMGAEQANG